MVNSTAGQQGDGATGGRESSREVKAWRPHPPGMGFKRARREEGCQTQWLGLPSGSEPSVRPQPTITSSYISSSHCLGCTNTPGARNICVSSIDIGD